MSYPYLHVYLIYFRSYSVPRTNVRPLQRRGDWEQSKFVIPRGTTVATVFSLFLRHFLLYLVCRGNTIHQPQSLLASEDILARLWCWFTLYSTSFSKPERVETNRKVRKSITVPPVCLTMAFGINCWPEWSVLSNQPTIPCRRNMTKFQQVNQTPVLETWEALRQSRCCNLLEFQFNLVTNNDEFVLTHLL